MIRTWEKLDPDDPRSLYLCNRCPDAAPFNPALEHHECRPAEVDDQEPELVAPPLAPSTRGGHGYSADEIRDRQAWLIDEFDRALAALAEAKNPRKVQAAQSRIKGLEMLRRTLATAYTSALDREQIELLEEYKAHAAMISRARK